MMCSKCVHGGQTRPKIRCTPTFFHHPIFEDNAICCQKKSKCSATYHSTVFDQNGSKLSSCCNNKQSKCPQKAKSRHCECCKDLQPQRIFRDDINLEQRQTEKIRRPQSAQKQAKYQRQISFNPNASNGFKNAGSHSELSHHTKLWYNPDKQILLRECSNCYTHGLPRERKMIEMYSNPFYPYYKGEGCGTNCGCGCQGVVATKNTQQKDQPNVLYKPTVQAKFVNSKCGQCKQFCPCDKQCFCSDNCPCCEQKIGQKNHPKVEKECTNCYACCSCGPDCTCGPYCHCCTSKNQKCNCSTGACNCRSDCKCGALCKCCPKFMVYGTCRCDKSCVCGPQCQCSGNCACCPKNVKIKCPKQSYKKMPEQKYCGCGPECGCGPQCRCGSQCKCQKMKWQANDGKRVKFSDNVATKSTVNNGCKKVKNQQSNIRKSQPVFKSITGPRR